MSSDERSSLLLPLSLWRRGLGGGVRNALALSLAFTLTASLAPQPAWAQARVATPTAQPPGAVPAMPTPPANLPFTAEVTGRRQLFAAYDAVRNAPAFGYTARVSVSQVVPARPRQPAPEVVIETGKAENGGQRFALSTEETPGTARNVRRAIVNDQAALVTRYEERGDGKTPPVREYTRLSVDPTTPIPRALRMMGYMPEAVAGRWLALDLPVLLRYATVYTDGGSAVIEYAREADERRGREVIRARRYRLDPATHRLTKYEEWTQSREGRGPAKDDRTLRIVYRSEEYTEWNLSKQAFAAATFDQSLPDTYKEKILERQPDPMPLPANADPKALALMDRWQAAQDRWLTYSATVEQTVRQTPRAADSRPVPPAWQNATARYAVQTRRHGQTRVTQTWLTGGDPRDTPRNALFVSNGRELRAINQDRNQSRSFPLDEPDQLWRQLNRANFEDYGGLGWIFTGVPRNARFTRIAYGGTTTTPDGETVDVLLLEYRDSNQDRRGRALDLEYITRVGLGADGLPRILEQTRKATISGGFERDNPPVWQVTTYYRNVRVDGEPASNAFAFPTMASK